MYKNLLSINNDNIGTVGVFDSEPDFRTGGAVDAPTLTLR